VIKEALGTSLAGLGLIGGAAAIKVESPEQEEKGGRICLPRP
jgi:hypothetical protein